jgi:hypothetical protein
MFTLVFAFVGIANAQQKRTDNSTKIEKHHKNFDEWSKALNLTDAQISKIQEINVKYKEKRAAIRNSGTQMDFKNLNDQKHAEIQNILTPEQKTKAAEFEEMKYNQKVQKASIKSSR